MKTIKKQYKLYKSIKRTYSIKGNNIRHKGDYVRSRKFV